MDAVVLVGGEGTRLRPLTYDIPKQMLPVVDRPMIEHVVSWLGGHGITRVVLSLGYRPDRFLEGYPDATIAGLDVVYAIEPELLDTAGAIRYAASTARVEDRFLVLNGDVMSDFDVTSLVGFHRESRAEATIQLTPVDDPSAFGVVPTDTEGLVTAFIEKPPAGTAPTNLVSAGCYVIEPSVLDRIAPDRRVSIEREIFPALVADASLYAMASDAYWLDTGTPAKYLQASLDILRGLRTPASDPSCAASRTGGDLAAGARRFIVPASHIEGSIVGCAYIGAGATLCEGSEVRDSAILDGATIGAGARVCCSLVLPGAIVEPGAVIDSSIVGPTAVIGTGARVSNHSVIGVGARVGAGVDLDAARYPDR